MKQKILVISLLRLGDIIMSTPVLRGLRERQPEAEIHLLINGQFAQITEMIPYVDKVVHFDRNELQRGLGEGDLSLFEPYERLKTLMNQLDSERYTQVINLTQNRLSGYLMSAISCKEKLGLTLQTTGSAFFNSPWFRYLNTQADADSESVFHYTDIFRFALGLDGNSYPPGLIETDAGQKEAQDLLGSETSPYILVQPLTSDVKKDWGIERFSEALTLLGSARPNLRILILGAPNEKERLLPLISTLNEKGINAKLAICSLAGAYSLLRGAEALLTGDTSIKHLACAAKTKLVELSLGSSDYHRTGAYLQGTVIIQAKELCAPCPHSKECHRDHHACAARIKPEAVAMVTSEVLRGVYHQLGTIAEEFQGEIDVLRVEVSESGFWYAWNVLEKFTEANVAHLLNLCAQKIHLESERTKDEGGLGELGSESLRLERLYKKIFPKVSGIEWEHTFDALESQGRMIEGRLEGFQVGLKSLYGNFESPERLRDFVKTLIAFREKLKTQPFLQTTRTSLDALIEDDITPPFVRFRRIADAVQEMRVRTDIELRVIRTLRCRLEESA